MREFYIIKLGQTFPAIAREHGDFEDWFAAAMHDVTPRVVDPRRGEALPPPAAVSGAVVTGSRAMVTDAEPWSEATGRWLLGLVEAEVPLLGVCYGHQLLARALGGRVGYQPPGQQLGTVAVSLAPGADRDPLLKALPPSFAAQVVHSQAVTALPPGAQLLARNGFDLPYAFRFGRCAWGLQFHPEIDASVMCAYLKLLGPELRERGVDTAALAAGLCETPEAGALLARFAALAAAQVVA